MAILLDFDFERTSPNPIDSSFVLTKAEMLAIDDNKMPDKYFAVCKDDGAFYLYDKSATPSATTGKFTELKGGGSGEEGKTYTMDWDESAHELTLTDGTTPQNLELTGLQGELTAGSNISIVEDPYTGATVISSTGGGSTYTAGNGIDITNDVISADTDVLQEKLVSGTNIKTVNGNSLLGSGDVTITGGAEFEITTSSDSGVLAQGNDYLGVDLSDANGPTLTLTQPGTYVKSKALQEKLTSGTNIKTFEGESILGSGNITIPTVVGSGWGIAKQGSVSASTSATSVSISDLGLSSVDDYQVALSIENTNGGLNIRAFVSKVDKNSFDIYASVNVTVYYTVFAKGYGGAPAGGSTNQILAKRSNATGDFEWVNPGVVADIDQTYDSTSSKAQSGIAVAEAVINKADTTYVDTADANLQAQIDGLGEPFRLQDFQQSINMTIPSCNQEIANTSINKLTIDLDVIDPTGQLGTDFAVASLAKYEVWDAASGGNRINCWPVCMFSEGGQKKLSLRFMCAGTSNKTALRISGAILLKHR